MTTASTDEPQRPLTSSELRSQQLELKRQQHVRDWIEWFEDQIFLLEQEKEWSEGEEEKEEAAKQQPQQQSSSSSSTGPPGTWQPWKARTGGKM